MVADDLAPTQPLVQLQQTKALVIFVVKFHAGSSFHIFLILLRRLIALHLQKGNDPKEKDNRRKGYQHPEEAKRFINFAEQAKSEGRTKTTTKGITITPFHQTSKGITH